MTHSKLASACVHAHSNNYSATRSGNKICKITPHHAVAVTTAAKVAETFQSPTRYASANYCIGTDGSIVCSLEEEHRSWCSSSKYNDDRAITIEVANSSVTDPNYPISDASWNALVNLCVDICQRYNFKLNYTGDMYGSLTMHKMFAPTACPGPYLEARFPQLAAEVNARLTGTSASVPATGSVDYEALATEVLAGKWGNGDTRKNGLNSKYGAGTYDKVQAIVNARLGGTATSAAPNYETLANEVIAGKWGNGDTRKNSLNQTYGAGTYDKVQAIVNQKVYGTKTTTSSVNYEALANEVMAGKLGNGTARKNALNSKYGAGTYDKVQAIVNKKIYG